MHCMHVTSEIACNFNTVYAWIEYFFFFKVLFFMFSSRLTVDYYSDIIIENKNFMKITINLNADNLIKNN